MEAILERKKAAATVIAASRKWARATAESLEELLRPELKEGETMPDLELLQRLVGRALARRWRRLEIADRVHARAAARRRRRADEQAAARAALYRRVVDLRRLLRGVFGAAGARRLLGIVGRTSEKASTLLRQAVQAGCRLREAAGALPPAAYRPSQDECERWVRPVGVAARDLESARSAASLAGKTLEAAVAERQRALDAWNGAFVELAAWLEATYRAAGRPERAGAVRPSRRRPGVLLDDDRRPEPAEAHRETPAAVEEARSSRPSHRQPIASILRKADRTIVRKVALSA